MNDVVDPKTTGSRLSDAAFRRLIEGNPPRIAEDGTLRTGAVRLAFAHLGTKTKVNAADADDKARYSVAGLFPHKNMKVVRDLLTAKVREYYPTVRDPSEMLNPKNKAGVIRDQGLRVSTADGGLDPIGRSYTGFVPGFMFVAPKSTRLNLYYHYVAGAVVPVPESEIDRVLYSGCWADLRLTVFKSPSASNPGPVFGLQSALKLADDTVFGGAAEATAESFTGAVPLEDYDGGSRADAGEAW